MADYSGWTVAQILKRKRAAIKRAKLKKGSPSWDDILDLTWEQIEDKCRRRETGFQTLRKLLKETRFDK